MNCEEAANFISARLDGEITADDERALEAHLNACASCRATAEALSQQHSMLEGAFAPERARGSAVAEATIRRLRRERPRSLRMPWMTGILSSAAGFVLAVLIFKPWVKTTPQSPGNGVVTTQQVSPARGVAKLALSTGAIESQSADGAWQPLPTGASISPNSRIRTGDKSRCEFELPDGSLVRLNAGSEVRFAENRQFELTRGQMFSTVARDPTPFVVAVGEAQVTALGTQFDVNVQPAVTTVSVIEGVTQIKGLGGSETLLFPSETVQIQGGRPGKVARSYNLMIATNWVNELLALKGRDNAELQKRINELLAELGQVKMSELYEEEIRSLGNHCLVPLSRYLQSSRSTGNDANETERRRRAARIVSDLAEPSIIPDLIVLLGNADTVVRGSAAQALERLTGENQGKTVAEWRQGFEPGPVQEQWRKWWDQNKDRVATPPSRNDRVKT